MTDREMAELDILAERLILHAANRRVTASRLLALAGRDCWTDTVAAVGFDPSDGKPRKVKDAANCDDGGTPRA